MMFSLILSILIFALVLMVIFYIACGIIMLFTGCDIEKAARIIQKFFSADVDRGIHTDMGFQQEVAETIKNILGDNMYEYMIRISKTAIKIPLLDFGEKSRLPYIAVSMFCDEQQKVILQSVLSNLVEKYLEIYKCSLEYIVRWKVREDLNMPYLEFIYARNENEKRILDILMMEEREKIKNANSPVIDDTETEKLNG